MLTKRALDAYLARLALPAPAIAYVELARSASPQRGVGSRRHNVSGRFPSVKMGHTRQFEARGTEGIGLLEYEYADNVLEYFDQPPSVVVRFHDRHGRTRGVRTHFDFLVLERDGIYLDEWKTEESLIGLVQRGDRYVRTETGWSSRAAEASVAEVGLRFRLRTPRSVDPALVLNAAFLADYWVATDVIEADLATAVTKAVRSAPGVSLGELLADVGPQHADVLYRLIADHRLYVDLRRYPIARTFQTPVWPSRAVAAAALRAHDRPSHVSSMAGVELRVGLTVDWSGRICQVVNVTASEIWLRPAGGELVPISVGEAERLVSRGDMRAVEDGSAASVPSAFRAASPAAMSVAEHRYHALERYWTDGIIELPRSTLFDWQRRYRAEEARSGFGMAGLLPGRRGRRQGSQLPLEIEQILQTSIDTFYQTLEAPTARALYDRVARDCSVAGLAPPAYATVLQRLKARDRHVSERQRAGHKKAYESAPHYWYLASDTPRHGERPWERAHIDHTQLDVVCVDSESGLPLGRPWLTLLLDAHTRRVLAIWITFDPPSYRSLMMVMRRCVERWARLPESIVVDGGAEFGSRYFEQFVARWRVRKDVRPGEPRFGAVIERFFGRLNRQLLHQLRGNTKITRNVRQITPATNPATRAVWTLASLDGLLGQFCFELYDVQEHPVLGASPRAFYDARMALTGMRPMRLIAYDEDFRMSTLPTTTKQTAKVDRVQGVKINGRRYRAPEFKAAAMHGRQVPVRYDPMDMRRGYAYVGDRWIECWCSELRGFGPVSEREIGHLSAEVRQRLRLHGTLASRRSGQMADLIEDATRREAVLLQARRDAEQRVLLSDEERTAEADPVRVSDARRPEASVVEPGPREAAEEPAITLEIFDAYG